MDEKFTVIGLILASIVSFISPFLAAGVAAIAWYLHLLRKDKIRFSIANIISTFSIGLFVGWMAEQVIIFVLYYYRNDVEIVQDLSYLHDLLIAVAGILAPQILSAFENADIKGLLKWIIQK